MYFLGIEHGTRGMRISLLPDTSVPEQYESTSAHYFEIKRNPAGEMREFPSIIEELEKHIDISGIKLGVMTYSMGDAFSEITDIKTLHDRGVRSLEGAGRIVGLGSSVFDELQASDITLFALPGIHRNTPSLHPAFCHFSHCSAPDKVCAAYQASLFLRSKSSSSSSSSSLSSPSSSSSPSLASSHPSSIASSPSSPSSSSSPSFSLPSTGKNFILCDVGANTVSLLVKGNRIIGGVDAALGSPGLVQGPIDIEGIRSIDHGDLSANERFSTGGYFGQPDHDLMMTEPDFREKYRSLIQNASMEVNSLRTFLPSPEAIVFTGSAPSLAPEIFRETVDDLFSGIPVHLLLHECGSLGCASMARDIHHGKTEFLGIRVNGL